MKNIDRFKFRAWNIIVERFQCFDFKELAQMNYKDIQWHILEFQQCTGIKDRKGNLIYEGDIVKFSEHYAGDVLVPEHTEVIEWNNGSFNTELCNTGFHDGPDWCEVVGNKYQNQKGKMTDKLQYKYDSLVDNIAGLCCGVINGDYCNHCWKFYLPYFLKRIFCGRCIALQDIITDLHHILDTADDSHTIDELLNQLIDSREALEKIKVIALDIIENDCYENSDTKAKKIIDIISLLYKLY